MHSEMHPVGWRKATIEAWPYTASPLGILVLEKNI